MGKETSQEIRSKVTEEGYMEISIIESQIPKPKENEVLVKMEAAPINPSDLGRLLSHAADLSDIKTAEKPQMNKIKIKLKAHLMTPLKPRLNQSLSLGNEGAGVVVEAGSEVKGMVGKTVALAGGGMYCQYRCIPANNCLIMDEKTTPKEAASSFVNPMTALGFIETMKLEDHRALIHTAASSNLGKMLIKICKNDSVPLINIVRNSKQIESLKDIGAEFVLSTSEENFEDKLIDSIKETGATLAFDATGGGNEGKLPGQILSAMERALLSSSEQYQIYGSDTHKQVYIYGGLDRSPTILNRSYGMRWSIGGWLLTPMINKFGLEKFQQMRERVAAEIKTIFASNYYKSISFEEAIKPDIIRSYASQTTGKKYLITPHKR